MKKQRKSTITKVMIRERQQVCDARHYANLSCKNCIFKERCEEIKVKENELALNV